MNMVTGLLAFGLFKIRIPDCDLWKCFQDEICFLVHPDCLREREDRRVIGCLPFTLQSQKTIGFV